MVAISITRVFVALNLGLAVAATYIPRAAPGTQFITGPCKSDADCASSCCGFNSGKCAGPVIAQQRDGGCGFGDDLPNNLAAVAIQGPNAILPGGVGHGIAKGGNKKGGKPAKGGKPPMGGKPAKGGQDAKGDKGGEADNGEGDAAAAPKDKGDAAGAAPKGDGKQFITGACKSDADCASGCCGFNSGKCAGPVVAQERDGGCGFGDGTPNDTAAKALQARALAGLL